MIKEKFASQVDNEPRMLEVDEAVAKGAATFGFYKVIQKKVEDIRKDENLSTSEKKKQVQKIADNAGITDVTVEGIVNTTIRTVSSRSYGIRVLNKEKVPVVYNMIHKQDQVPVSYEREFPVSVANAEKLPLAVFSNNSMEDIFSLEESESVGDAVMELPPGLPQGAPIRIKFTLTEDGVLTLDAVDVTHNTPVHATFEAKGGLSQEQIQKARQETADIILG